MFGKKATEDEVIMEILNKGEYQIGDKEREQRLEDLRNKVSYYI